jgi:putative glutamine amidotransferase
MTPDTSSLPIIGITTYGRDVENKFALPAEYVDSVRRAGGIPVLLPPGEVAFARLLDQLDGLILAGGGDLDPRHYDGEAHETIYMLDQERDVTELAMAQHVVDQEVPTLGICRGAQVVNVALGGTLIEHLPDEVGESILHRLPPRNPSAHAVDIDPSSRLAKILQTSQIDSASWHHQAVREVADGLEVVALAADGTIEAIEMQQHPWLVTVQWHPELTAADDPVQQRLFDAFVEACRENRFSE